MNPRFQFNYYVNTMCNQHCDYCYARDGMKWNTILKFENIERDLKVLEDAPHSIVSLIGGEPTLYPKFERILNLLRGSKHELHVYTNGTTNFYKNLDLDLCRLFTWTFSYHGKETDESFFKNISYMNENNIRVEITIPAQNMTREFLKFVEDSKIKTVITFIHNTSNQSYDYSIEEWVFEIRGENIKNYSKFSREKVSYFGKTCHYGEIDVVNSHMTSNDCNHSIDAPLNKRNLRIIKDYKYTICEREFCKQDCAFLIPEKV